MNPSLSAISLPKTSERILQPTRILLMSRLCWIWRECFAPRDIRLKRFWLRSRPLEKIRI